MTKRTGERLERQAQLPETADEFRTMLRQITRRALMSLLEEEVTQLCGSSHARGLEREMFRAGGTQSVLYVEGRREKVRRPRIRRKTATGSEEAALESWKLASDPGQWEEAMYHAILCGVSTRNVGTYRMEELSGESRSSLSRLWSRKAADLIDQVQQSDLGAFDLVVLMIDAVVLCQDLVATVALGMDAGGNKRVLGFRIGSSESAEVCTDLLQGLCQRGLRREGNRSLLVVLDGSKALEKAVAKVFPGTLLQRCLVHKERNIKRYLPRRHWPTITAMFNRFRRCQGEEAAKEASEEIAEFLADKNAQARESFEEAGEDLLTVFRLEIPNTLNPTLLSTNAIENAFKNLRRHIGRVCRWRQETAQADRWVASGLHLAQRGFRRVRGYQDMGHLIEALKKDLSIRKGGNAA